jgi:hypothetical protein
MKTTSRLGLMGLLAVNVLLWLGFAAHQPSGAAQRGSPTTLANPAAQRGEMIRELSAIKSLLREQNELLRSGKVKVVATQADE